MCVLDAQLPVQATGTGERFKGGRSNGRRTSTAAVVAIHHRRSRHALLCVGVRLIYVYVLVYLLRRAPRCSVRACRRHWRRRKNGQGLRRRSYSTYSSVSRWGREACSGQTRSGLGLWFGHVGHRLAGVGVRHLCRAKRLGDDKNAPCLRHRIASLWPRVCVVTGCL